MKSNTVVGCFEQVSIPEFKMMDTIAKIDTGAYSGAVHCSNIKETTTDDGTRLLTFRPSNHRDVVIKTSSYDEVTVRSATGHSVQRYRVSTRIIVLGQSFPITIGLSDRKDLKSEVLIGRRFLREQNMLVDVRINEEHDTDGDREKK